MTRIQVAVASSLVLHAIVILAAGHAAVSISGQENDTLSVQLTGRALDQHSVRDARHAARPDKASRNADRLAHAAGMAQHSLSSTESAFRLPQPISAADKKDPMPSPAADGLPSSDDPVSIAQSRIRMRLRADIARHFDYPDLARRQGWQGQVLVAFNVESDGRLQQIRVARSSGFAILDDSALQSLRQIERITEAAALPNGQRLAMQIPVTYRLQGEP
jgi:protein TonB